MNDFIGKILLYIELGNMRGVPDGLHAVIGLNHFFAGNKCVGLKGF